MPSRGHSIKHARVADQCGLPPRFRHALARMGSTVPGSDAAWAMLLPWLWPWLWPWLPLDWPAAVIDCMRDNLDAVTSA